MQHVHVNIPVKDLSKKKNIPVKASWHVQSQVSEDINKHEKKNETKHVLETNRAGKPSFRSYMVATFQK